MTRIVVLCCVLAIVAGSAPSLVRAAVTVSPSRTEVSTSIGRDFTFSTRVANRASVPTQALVAHLNVLSLRPGVYVDPEDWSSRRTVFTATKTPLPYPPVGPFAEPPADPLPDQLAGPPAELEPGVQRAVLRRRRRSPRGRLRCRRDPP